MVQINFLFSLLAATGITAVNAIPVETKPGLEGIPVGAKDGLYIGHIKDDGKTNWEFLGAHNQSIPVTARDDRPLAARAAIPYATCAGFGVNADQVNVAQGYLANLCGNGYYFSGRSIAQVYGGGVAYACNYASSQTCHSGDVWDFFGDINHKCGFAHGGQAGAGWESVPAWKAAYGRTSTGTGFC